MDIYIIVKYYFTSSYKSIQFATASKDEAFEFFDKQEKNCSYFWIIEKWIGEKCKILKTEIK